MIAIKNYSYVYATIIIKENIKLRVQGSMRGTGRKKPRMKRRKGKWVSDMILFSFKMYKIK